MDHEEKSAAGLNTARKITGTLKMNTVAEMYMDGKKKSYNNYEKHLNVRMISMTGHQKDVGVNGNGFSLAKCM